MTPEQIRALLHVQQSEMLIAAKAKERMESGVEADPMQNSAQGTTRKILAQKAGVSHDTISKAVLEKAGVSRD